jgi:peptidoglycan/LPS O-acetylase OafA/YrhL
MAPEPAPVPSPTPAPSPGIAGAAYRPDLDGLRAIAVGLVMVAHLQWPWPMGSADIGVTAFFLLSGYLITTLLVRERERTGGIRLGAFYRRRALRLGPALLGLLAFALALGLSGALVGQWQLGIASSLLYVSNWVQAAGIPIHPLGHTWSLSIEEQFYLVWPVVLVIAWRRALGLALVVGAVAIVVRLVASGFFEYFSTVTRIDAILLGCVVALARPRWPAWTAAAGVLGLMLAGLVYAPEQHGLAILTAMVATTAVIAGRLEPLGRLAPVGLRAYSLYLWNTPMTLLFAGAGLVAPVLTILVGEISYRLLEVPVLRRGGARRRAEPEPPGRPLPVAVEST